MTAAARPRPPAGHPHAEVWSWVHRAQDGDAEAFGLIYDRYHYHVLTYVTRRVNDRDTAEDITQDVFLRAMNAIDRYEYQGRDYIAVLLTIARNIVIDQSRSLRFRVEVFDREDEVIDMCDPVSVESTVLASADNAELLWYLKRLPEAQQRAIALVYFGGLNSVDAGQAIGKTSEALKALTLRGRRTLAQILPAHLQRS